MLTYHQAETATYMNEDGSFFHPACAREAFGTLSVEKADIGLTNAYNLSPLSRYSLDEYRREAAWEYARQGEDFEDLNWAQQEERVDSYAEGWVTCDYCGEAIS